MDSSDFVLFMKVNQLKQKEVAAYLDVTPQYISQIVKGLSKLQESRIKSLRENPAWDSSMLNDEKNTDIETDSSANLIPLLPISAQGGNLNDFVTSVREIDCEKIISPITRVDFAMTVTGDSMAPEYPSGSTILLRRINEGAFIDWGRTYVLDTCNGSVIKRLMPSEDTEKLMCVSINPDYPPFEVCRSDIYGIYRVMLCMAVK